MKKFVFGYLVLASSIAVVSAAHNVALKHKLPARCKKPNLSSDQIIGYSMGIRPFRTSGVRLETEKVESKAIIHNYGHGGSGVTLSWGCAEVSADLVKQEADNMRGGGQHKSVAIVGAGVIGLSTAHALLDKGYSVTIYAQEFPPHVTAGVGTGIIRPFGLGEGQDKVILEKLYELSLERFKKLAHEKNPEFHGVKYITKFKLKPGAQAQEDKTLTVQTTQYMKDLFDKAQEKGAEFVIKTFSTRDEVLLLKEGIIINCAGYGAKELFNDQEMYPIRGHMVHLAPQDGVDYIVGKKGESGNVSTFLVPHDDKIMVGGSYEEHVDTREVDHSVCKMILDQARSFFDEIEFEGDEGECCA